MQGNQRGPVAQWLEPTAHNGLVGRGLSQGEQPVAEGPATDFATEEWRPVAGYEGRFDVSSFGRVRALRFVNNTTDRALDVPRIMSLTASHRTPYLRIGLGANGTRWTPLVHRLVAVTFLGPCPEGKECAHLDGDPKNNHVSNLAWVTKVENEAHKKIHAISRPLKGFAMETIATVKARNSELAQRCQRLEAALRELVTLKDMKEDFMHCDTSEYQRRKPLAWEAARAALEDAS